MKDNICWLRRAVNVILSTAVTGRDEDDESSGAMLFVH